MGMATHRSPACTLQIPELTSANLTLPRYSSSQATQPPPRFTSAPRFHGSSSRAYMPWACSLVTTPSSNPTPKESNKQSNCVGWHKLALPPMASPRLVFVAPLLALLVLSAGALESAGGTTTNGTSADGASSLASSADGAAAGIGGMSLGSSGTQGVFSLDRYGGNALAALTLASHLVFAAPLLAWLFAPGALEAPGTTNGTSVDGADTGARARPLGSSVSALDRYGARGDGRHDDTQALARAWKAACASPRPAVVLVPGGKRYLLKLVTLHGPCRSRVTLTVKGTLVASPNRADWSDRDRRLWVVFRSVSSLIINGGGTIDGNGNKWWPHSCKINKALPCKEAPTAFSFHFCTNLRVEDLKIVNSQQIHVSVEDCTNVHLARLSITAPDTSPNTDGIHITRSKDVKVTDCKIKTGDDCISIEHGTHNLHVSKVVCGPGHGISIGSLGDDNSRAEVSGITIDTVQLYSTTNGARIKTYQGGSGYAKDITFQNMIMYNVKNPIIIDQNYCDKNKPCKEQRSAVEVSNVVFKNIRGTTITKDAIKLKCSKHVPCHGITLQNINLKMQGGKGATESTCQNAKWRKSGTVIPQPCTAQNYEYGGLELSSI